MPTGWTYLRPFLQSREISSLIKSDDGLLTQSSPGMLNYSLEYYLARSFRCLMAQGHLNVQCRYARGRIRKGRLMSCTDKQMTGLISRRGDRCEYSIPARFFNVLSELVSFISPGVCIQTLPVRYRTHCHIPIHG